MGIDWQPMKLKSGVSRELVGEIIDTQAKSFQANPYYWDTSGLLTSDSEPGKESEDLINIYVKSSDALRDCLEIYTDTIFRVYPITHSIIFPPEWRLAALRTFLPEELPSQLSDWYDYLVAINEGFYRPYLFQLYLYEISIDLFTHWKYLRETAEFTLEKTNAWARRREFVEVRQEILELPQPHIYPSPLWSYFRTLNHSIDYANDIDYCGILSFSETVVKLTRAFDSKVKGSWKIRWYDPVPTFEQFLEGANDDWIQQFMAWTFRCTLEHKGLFFYY